MVDSACFYFALEDVQLEALKAPKEGVGHNIYHSYFPTMGRWDVLFPALRNNSQYHSAAFHIILQCLYFVHLKLPTLIKKKKKPNAISFSNFAVQDVKGKDVCS